MIHQSYLPIGRRWYDRCCCRCGGRRHGDAVCVRCCCRCCKTRARTFLLGSFVHSVSLSLSLVASHQYWSKYSHNTTQHTSYGSNKQRIPSKYIYRNTPGSPRVIETSAVDRRSNTTEYRTDNWVLHTHQKMRGFSRETVVDTQQCVSFCAVQQRCTHTQMYV